MINKFVEKFGERRGEHKIISISSGAGKKAIDGWFAYCSSKAATDMQIRVLNEDLRQNRYNIKARAIAPGIVDTEMQNTIRSQKVQNFSAVETFKDYYKNGDLRSPGFVANELIKVINNIDEYNEIDRI